MYNAVLGSTTVSFQEGVSGYTGTKDTDIDFNAPTSNNGTNTDLEADSYNGGGGVQGLIRFDNLFGSGANQIPTGAIINSATLMVDVTDASSTSAQITFHQLLTNWDESSTWNSLSGGISLDDVEASSTADAIVAIPDATGTVTITGLESSLQNWSNGATNSGWVFVIDNTNGWHISSSEEGNVNLRPKLTVEYSNTSPVAANDSYTVDEDTTLNSNNTWYDSNWAFRRTLSFNNLSQSENLSDFPVLVALDSSRIDYSQTQNNGEDLRFVDGDGTLLAHEIESWDESGTSYVWVKVPQIDASSGSDFIWMYYGNSSAADGQDSANVWTEGYRAVYHLDETGVTFSDSTTNFSNATDVNTSTSVSGQIGTAREFNGSDEYIDLGSDQPFINNVGAAALSAWIKPDTISGGEHHILSVTRNGATNESRAGLFQNNSNIGVFARSLDDDSDAVTITTTTSPLTAGQWHHVVAVIDYANDSVKIFVNGVEQSTTGTAAFTNTTTPNTNSSNAAIGVNEGGSGGYFDGTIDDARIAAVTRSADWIAAQYAAMADQFVTFGYEQTKAGVLGNDIDSDGDNLTAILVSGPSNAASFTLNLDGSFSYTPTGNFSGSDSFTYKANDGTTDSNIATVNITVNAVKNVPVAGNDSYTVDEDRQLIIAANGVLANDNDDDNDPLSAVLVDPPANGTLVFNADGTFEYRPNEDFNGVDQWTYQATDGGLSSNTATVQVTVNSINDAPVTVNDTLTVVNSNTVIINIADQLLGNDQDVDGDTLTLISFTQPQNGTLVDNGDGTLTYTVANTVSGSESFSYTVSDGNGGTHTADVELAIHFDAPVLPGTTGGTGSSGGGDGEEIKTDDTTPIEEDEIIEYQTAEDGEEPERETELAAAAFVIPTETRLNNLYIKDEDRLMPQSYRVAPEELEEMVANIDDEQLEKTLASFNLLENASFLEDLEHMKSQIDPSARHNLMVQGVTGTSLVFSAGFVNWLFRGGSLLASFLSSVPLWKTLDPLPILTYSAMSQKAVKAAPKTTIDGDRDEDDDAIEDLFSEFD